MKRLHVEEDRTLPVNIEDESLCYWKAKGDWFIYLPLAGIGRLTMHQIVEHEDGTISVTPSVLLRGHHGVARHGFITRGEWLACADDGK